MKTMVTIILFVCVFAISAANAQVVHPDGFCDMGYMQDEFVASEIGRHLDTIRNLGFYDDLAMGPVEQRLADRRRRAWDLSDKRFEHENNCPKGYISDRTEFSRLAIEADVLFDTLRTIKEYLQGEERYQDLIRYWELELEVRTAELRRKAYYYVVFNPDIEFYPEED